jgi:hypothetical protein
VCDGGERERVCLSNGCCLRRLEKRYVRPYLSVFGKFELHRVIYGTREGQKIEHVPLGHRLRLPKGKFSHLLNDWN